MSYEFYQQMIKRRYKRLRWLTLFILFLICFVEVATETNLLPVHLLAKETGYQLGFMIGFQLAIGIKLVKMHRFLHDEQRLYAAYCKENDERRKMIEEKSNVMTFRLLLIMLVGCTMVAGYFDKKTFFILLILLFVILFAEIAIKKYFSYKY
jgi:hypothetical protein